MSDMVWHDANLVNFQRLQSAALKCRPKEHPRLVDKDTLLRSPVCEHAATMLLVAKPLPLGVAGIST